MAASGGLFLMFNSFIGKNITKSEYADKCIFKYESERHYYSMAYICSFICFICLNDEDRCSNILIQRKESGRHYYTCFQKGYLK